MLNTRMTELSDSEDFVILAGFVWPQYQHVTDGCVDGLWL